VDRFPVAFLATTLVLFAIAQKATNRHLQLNGSGTVASEI
jgi:hypothetical protein